MRADRLGDVSASPAFARLVERGLYLLGRDGRDDLRAAIEGPAHQAGLLLEPGLVDLLVREVEGEPGALPLLSHALRQTWERREGRTLTVAGYRATGGIRGAVAQSAEEVYERPAGRAAAAAARPAAAARRRQRRRRAGPRPGAAAQPGRPTPTTSELIELLVAARLVTSDDDVVELAHEALARAWPRLRGWLDDDVEGQRILRHLAGAADTWDAMGRPDSELYRGVRLAQALGLTQQADPPTERDLLDADLTPTEREFLDTGAASAERETASTVGGETSGVIVVSAAAARRRRRRRRLVAVRQGTRAERAAVAADARRAAALALDADDVDRSLLLAVEAVRLDDSPDTRASLLAALSRSRL